MTTSHALFQRASRYVPGGVHSNTRFQSPHPVYFHRAEGPYLWDVEGDRYLDCTMGNASVMLGHRHPDVDAAVTAAVSRGLTTGVETEDAVHAVERLAGMIPDFGRVKFANTGTEALMHALAIARHSTGRERVAKAEGAYHGWFDPLWVSTWPAPDQLGPAERPAAPPSSAGLSRSAGDTVVLPFNDLAATERLLREHAAELAAVVVEPVLIDIGFIPATGEYLRLLRDLTAELGIVLIFDELLTGFRLAPGGARQVYGITPDLTTYGKAIANGYPLAAVEGRTDLLAVTDPSSGGPVGWVGTYNGHGSAVAAAAAALPLLADGSAQAYLDKLGTRLREGFAELSRTYDVPALVAGAGGHFQPYFMSGPVTGYRTAMASDPARYAILHRVARERRILLPAKPLLHAALSTAHTEADVEALLEAAEEAFAEMRSTT
ncbi:aminotransferase class III-fold pyridoxal phosphate-dependent enzyme [Nonomuraea sp. K274]|uniref:Aminotransferase class III-fold pyridoxal phosphate-dependent enzyme n=1 Tax=Nonomuraea cypriaca TaxID=1187855 RepID=A0A931A5V5_9ACTN|nr:aminotransferase class III-fold pyridoxal phosphate-dependent enzyme [Nonomuraea cypriaca]MBF8185289.1 aminotransferase class III-fold pyridoxal phosphate-dependent enzyme [Nonomuraea cypriaca]